MMGISSMCIIRSATMPVRHKNCEPIMLLAVASASPETISWSLTKSTENIPTRMRTKYKMPPILAILLIEYCINGNYVFCCKNIQLQKATEGGVNEQQVIVNKQQVLNNDMAFQVS